MLNDSKTFRLQSALSRKRHELIGIQVVVNIKPVRINMNITRNVRAKETGELASFILDLSI